MSVIQIVFSPTGGTQKVADAITSKWKQPVTKMDLSKADTADAAAVLHEDDLAVIAVPSFGGRAPAPAIERLKQIAGGQALCVVVCVYGNRAYEDTLIELSDAAKQCGFRVIAGIAAIAEHSIMHQYAAGRPDAADQNELQAFAEKIMKKIHAEPFSLAEPKIPGHRPYKKAGAAGLVPKTDKRCNSCGRCARECPTQAISRENPGITDSKKCISCMRCVERCPQKARRVNKMMVSIAALAIKKACSQKKANELFL